MSGFNNPWNAAQQQGLSSSIHAPQGPPQGNQGFAANAASFGLGSTSGAGVGGGLPDIDEEETFSETRRPSTHAQPEDEEEEEEDNDRTLTRNLTKILRQQVRINEQLMASRNAGSASTLPVQLPFFHGRANENVQTWLFQLSQIFRAKGINSGQSIHYVAACLKEAALHWYQNQFGEPGSIHPFRDFDIFAQRIKAAFEPPHYQQILRRQLRALTQKDSVQRYVYEFRNIVGQIEDMGNLDQVMHFIDGLKQATKVEVNYKAPDNLEEAITAAIAYDTARFGPSRAYLPSSYQYYTPNQQPQKQGQKNHHRRDDGGVRPMEIDSAEARRQGNQSNKAGKGPQRTDKELAEFRKAGKCFRCANVGHLSRNCPSRNGSGGAGASHGLRGSAATIAALETRNRDAEIQASQYVVTPTEEATSSFPE